MGLAGSKLSADPLDPRDVARFTAPEAARFPEDSVAARWAEEWALAVGCNAQFSLGLLRVWGEKASGSRGRGSRMFDTFGRAWEVLPSGLSCRGMDVQCLSLPLQPSLHWQSCRFQVAVSLQP